MIYVKRNTDETSQKVVGSFLKRVKKFNLISRKRKTQFHSKPISHLQKQRKAIRKAKYTSEQEIASKSAK